MIYIITNKTNNKQYIGKTEKTIEERWKQHCYNAKRGINTHLYKAIRKYGESNFTIDFLCDGLDNEEVIMIESMLPAYNMTKGGTGGNTSFSPNYIIAMKKRNYYGANNHMFGKRGINNPKFGKKYGKKPNISESKKKTLKCNNGHTFKGFKELFDFYNVKSYYSLKKRGITWSEI